MQPCAATWPWQVSEGLHIPCCLVQDRLGRSGRLLNLVTAFIIHRPPVPDTTPNAVGSGAPRDLDLTTPAASPYEPMNNASSFVPSSAPVVQSRRSGSRLPQSLRGRLRPVPPLWPPASAISPAARSYDSGIQDSLRGSWIGTRPVMSTGPILVLAKPPKSRRAREATRLYNELPTILPLRGPQRQSFFPVGPPGNEPNH